VSVDIGGTEIENVTSHSGEKDIGLKVSNHFVFKLNVFLFKKNHYTCMYCGTKSKV